MALTMAGHRLGDRVDSEFEVQQYQVCPQDSFFWFTDGLIEGEEPGGGQFGEKRLQDAIREHGHLAPDEAMKQIVEQAAQFYHGAEQKDDITLVVGQIA